MLLGLDVMVVQEVLRGQPVESVPRAPEAVIGIMNLRGRLLGVTDVRTRLGRPPAANMDPTYVVVRDGDDTDVLRVDAPAEVVTMDDQACLPVPDTTPAVIASNLRGAFDLDGQVLLVVDLNRLLHTRDDWVAMPHAGVDH
jgi:purine-binding chemotaxis protein CheW